MTPQEAEQYLREHIPLSAGMDIAVVEAGPGGVSIEAPLGPNVNHRATAFGGSVSALAILAGWTLVDLRLQAEGLVTHTVIQSNAVQYDAPIRGTFSAVTEPVNVEAWEKFTRAITRHGKGRVRICARVVSEGRTAATFAGAYVAFARERDAESI